VAIDPSPAPPPLRVAAFTGGAAVPPARLRVRQYIAPLAGFGIDVRESWPGLGAFPPRQRSLRPAWLIGTMAQRLLPIAAGWRADITLLQREMVSTLPTLEGWTRRPRLVDVDDAVHLHRGGMAARRLAALADLVVVGNSWLAETWRHWNPAIEILPTPVDTDRYAVRPFPEQATIGWIGTAGNLRYLAAIAPALRRVLERFPGTAIAVCCDQPPALPGFSCLDHGRDHAARRQPMGTRQVQLQDAAIHGRGATLRGFAGRDELRALARG
jgi:hypothetical protein